MKRGSIVIGARRGEFTGKPRPWLVIQREIFLQEGGTVTVCMMTTGLLAEEFRVAVRASPQNGLEADSTVLADKVTTLRWSAIDRVAGNVDTPTLMAVDEALRLWLDL